MPQALSALEQHRLWLKLRPLPVVELFLVTKLQSPLYVWEKGLFQLAVPAGEAPGKERIKQLIQMGVQEVFLTPSDIALIRQQFEEALTKVTRALSVGDPLENGTRAVKLMAFNLKALYQNPHDDNALKRQFQLTQNMARFFLENRKIQSQLYQVISKENFHFTILQPMLSSLLMLGFLQHTHMFHEHEVESLYLTSYLKDVGMSLIPAQKHDQTELSLDEKELFSKHADFSLSVLEGRVPLNKNQLTIIKHHHFLNERIKRVLNHNSTTGHTLPVAFGAESTMLAVSDMLVAMCSNRPYRAGLSTYQSLEVIRKVIADDYPQEFRALVIFLKQFFHL